MGHGEMFKVPGKKRVAGRRSPQAGIKTALRAKSKERRAESKGHFMLSKSVLYDLETKGF